jgi:SOS-response transcriptional repressor LexA
MNTQSERLQVLMNSREVPPRKQRRALEKVSGARYETVRQWFFKGLNNISSEYLAKIAKAYNCRLEWLITGEGVMDSGGKYTNGREVSVNSRRIPVLSDIQAGDPRRVVVDYHAGAGMSEIAVDGELEQELGLGAFALVISGNSMEPDYREGDVVVVDPDVKPWPGDIVVALIESEEGSTIKKYRSRGNDETGHHIFELVPINEDYQTITVSSKNPGHIIGTVVEHRRNLRRRR